MIRLPGGWRPWARAAVPAIAWIALIVGAALLTRKSAPVVGPPPPVPPVLR